MNIAPFLQTAQSTGSSQYVSRKGAAYVQVQETSPAPHPQTTADQLPTILDPIAIQLMQFHNRLSYAHEEDQTYLLLLADMISDMHTYFVAKQKPLPKLRLQDILISAEQFSFISEKAYLAGAHLDLLLAFPHYPFDILKLKARVIDCQPSTLVGKYETHTCFEDLSDKEQEHIIQYVNYLERQEISKKSPT